eukprot:gnl/TRDRNA2_/TRDRNA2_154549_c1_seq1.p1 gnl/TRDRNA2_/TRDRNA2_154549_c1~~gnl/TRDRNA2_/TRDRNA2_154549_c1_seq1.p1  ORF type:complete len:236 (-),score=13.88 gnl/TRDRNA2_/TRDRNA2_154549_c1_seq1:174-881(-)
MKEKNFLRFGDKYSCVHINLALWDKVNGTLEAIHSAFRNPMLLESDAPFQRVEWRGVSDSRRSTQLRRNIFIAAQEDQMVKRMVANHLKRLYNWTDNDISLFALGDLGAPNVGRSNWGHVDYIWRAAVSVALCMPNMADSYIGEFFSGFTWSMLARALVHGPFDNNWLLQIYGHCNIGKQNCHYPGLLYHGQRPKPPPWVQIVGYSNVDNYKPCILDCAYPGVQGCNALHCDCSV